MPRPRARPATLRDLVVPAIAALAADRSAGALSLPAARRIAADLTALAAALVAEVEPPANAESVRPIAVAGPADRALAAAVAAAARLRGWRDARQDEVATMAVLCMSQSVSAPRLRRARAEAQRVGSEVLGLAPDEAAAAQLVAVIAPGPVSRSLEAVAARFGQASIERTPVAPPGDQRPLALGIAAPA